MSDSLQTKFDRAKALVKAKQYQEARNILASINHPKAKQWLAEIDKREVVAKPVKAQIGAKRFFVWFWGILVLASCGWMVFGCAVTQTALGTVMNDPLPTVVGLDPTAEAFRDSITNSAKLIGGGLGASLGIGLFLCTGIPVFIVALVFYLNTSGRIRKEQQHAETLNAMRGVS